MQVRVQHTRQVLKGWKHAVGGGAQVESHEFVSIGLFHLSDLGLMHITRSSTGRDHRRKSVTG